MRRQVCLLSRCLGTEVRELMRQVFYLNDVS